jgi:hypothetical protein
MAAEDHLAKQQLAIHQQRAELESLKLEEERQRVKEKVTHRRVLRKERLRTRQLKERHRQLRLTVSLQSNDGISQGVQTHLVDMSKRSKLQQLAITMFMSEVRALFDSSGLDDVEKVARIRAVLETYKREAADLPPEIRRFVQRVERDSAEGSYE